MRIIISPAKKMNIDTDSLPWRDLPMFIERSEQLRIKLKSMSRDELKALWKCSDKIVEQNFERLNTLELRSILSPAVLAYEGIQYQYMAPGVFTGEEFEYIQERLRILSGFYGILRPFDGVVPYRLEMQSALSIDGKKNLYAYWGDSLAKQLFSESDVIINLASKEYSLCVSPYLNDNIRFITCVFGEEKNGRVQEKGTMCKMARGEMVRYMAENNISDPDEIKAFDRLGYAFSEKRSEDNTFVFLLKQ